MRKIILPLLMLAIFVSFTPEKPKVLIIGDSISIGYTPFVKENLKNIAIVKHNPGNAQHTGTGLEKIDSWLGDTQWDVIHFNWGLWDLCYRHKDSKLYGNRDKINGKQTFSLEEYSENLEKLVIILKSKTEAKLIFVTTSYVPKEEGGRFEKDAQLFNKAAKKVMKKHGIPINDIYSKSKKIHKSHGLGIDDVHFSKEGYELLAAPISTFILKHL